MGHRTSVVDFHNTVFQTVFGFVLNNLLVVNIDNNTPVVLKARVGATSYLTVDSIHNDLQAIMFLH